MTTAGLHRPAPGSVPPAAAVTRRDQAAAGWRLARLYLISRRAPMALALLAVHAFVAAAAGSGNPAQQAVQAELLRGAGIPFTEQPETLGIAGLLPSGLVGPNGPGPATGPVYAAARRLAALPAAARHAWLATHLAALRAGRLTLRELP